MKKIDKILILCSRGEVSMKEIAFTFGWKTGTTGTILKQLIDKGCLRKTRHGFYITTEKGIDRIKERLGSGPDPREEVDAIAYRAAAFFTEEPSHDADRTIRYSMGAVKHSEQTKRLGDAFRNVYVEAVISVHRRDYDLMMGMWRAHQKTVCKACSFDFDGAYESNENQILDIVRETPLLAEFSKARLFENLRWESLPDVEKYRINLGMPPEPATSGGVPESEESGTSDAHDRLGRHNLVSVLLMILGIVPRNHDEKQQWLQEGDSNPRHAT